MIALHMQAMIMALALLACLSPAFSMRTLNSMRELQGTCSCSQYASCAKCKGYDPVSKCWKVDQSGCGTCGLGGELVDLKVILPPIICLAADIDVHVSSHPRRMTIHLVVLHTHVLRLPCSYSCTCVQHSC